jgi:DNA polymerase I
MQQTKTYLSYSMEGADTLAVLRVVQKEGKSDEFAGDAARDALQALVSAGAPLFVYDAKELYKYLLRLGFVFSQAQKSLFIDLQTGAFLSEPAVKKQSIELAGKGDILAAAELIESTMPETVRKAWLSVESPLTYIVAQMELNGVYLDTEKLASVQSELAGTIAITTKAIHKKLGNASLNINSTQQLGMALLGKGFNLEKTGKSGSVSTDRDSLEKLRVGDDTGLIEDILLYRTVAKLQSGCITPLLDQIDISSSRIHTTYNQVQASTGRLSSQNPNLQNIPVRDEHFGSKIRSCISAEEGNVLVGADYSQIELRFLAHFTGEPVLVEAFAAGQDIHARTAAEIFGVEVGAVTSVERRVGKTLNFALLYQQSIFGTAKQLGVDGKTAKGYVERYFERFPGIKPFIAKVLTQAKACGYTETYAGRRVYYPELTSRFHGLRAAAERAAFNSVLQGSNADLIKMAMLRLDDAMTLAEIPYRLILQVHDELIMEVAEKYASKAAKILKEAMELGQPLTVPVLVEGGIGKNWSQIK